RPAVVAFLAGHRAEDGQLAAEASELGPMFGDDNAGRCGGNGAGRTLRVGAGLGVKRLKLARPAGHPEKDDGFALPADLLGVEGQAVEEAEAGCAGAKPAQKAAAAEGAVAADADGDAGLSVHRTNLTSPKRQQGPPLLALRASCSALRQKLRRVHEAPK